MSDNPEDDFVEVPATESKVRFGDAAYTGAALSTMFAPGAGVADVMGYAPDPFNPGQMSPSFSENVEQGNYLDAGLQTLGVAGDAMYAMAPFTAGITALPGGVLKGAQALAKTLRGGSIPNPKTTTPQVFFPDLGENSHVTLQPNTRDDAVNISYIEADTPGQGQGGEMLRRITEQADATGTRLTLYPRSEGGLDQDELIAFYQRNGFEFQYPDPTNPEPILDMIREPRPTAPKSGATPQDFEFYQDNPAVSRPDSGKEWLESNIRFTEERYADREPSMLRGPITANLGSRNTDMFLSTDELTQLPGAMGETRGPGDPNFDRLLKQIKTEGFDPDQAGNKVVVGVNHKGEAYLMEGNTRAAVAKELGIPNIKTEVRYWNGGEMIDGPYKPEAVAARAVVNKAEGGVITLADVARNMNRGLRGVAALAPIARNMNRPMVS